MISATLMQKIRVIHIGHSPRWRGGENQVRLLVEEMRQSQPGVEHHLAFPKGAMILERLQSKVDGYLELAGENPFSLSSVWALVRYCRKHQITLLHAHSGNAHTLAYLAKRFISNSKLIVHRRVDNPIKTKHFTRKKYLSDKVDAFIAVSKVIKDLTVAYGVDDKKVHLVYDSVDYRPYLGMDKSRDKQSLIDRFGWEAESPLIGFVAALENQKNPELFVEVMRLLREKGVGFNAVIAGRGKREKPVSDLIAQYDIADQCKLLGFISEIEPIFRALDILILPSINEGLGTVMLEAISAEAVVVASDVGGISEVIIDEETGLLARSRDADQFVSQLMRVLSDPELQHKLKSGATAHMDANFSLPLMAQQTFELYQRVLGMPKAVTANDAS